MTRSAGGDHIQEGIDVLRLGCETGHQPDQHFALANRLGHVFRLKPVVEFRTLLVRRLHCLDGHHCEDLVAVCPPGLAGAVGGVEAGA